MAKKLSKPKRAKKPAPKKPARSKAAKKAPRRAAPKAKVPDQAAKMAAFSKRVVREESAPVAVRSFNEARAGIAKSKELDVKTGHVKPASPAPVPRNTAPPPQATAPKDIDDEIEADLAEAEEGITRPRLEPLTGPLAVPKKKADEEFTLAEPKRGKKAEPPTREDLGKIELRMQRGSGDATIGRASADYLQRSFKRAVETGKVAAASTQQRDEKSKPDEFQVAQDRPSKRPEPALTDFGDIEIAQQTRSGRKKLGKLDTDEETTS